MGGGTPPAVPDYKIYEVKGVADAEWVQNELAKKGLKDPWLR